MWLQGIRPRPPQLSALAPSPLQFRGGSNGVPQEPEGPLRQEAGPRRREAGPPDVSPGASLNSRGSARGRALSSSRVADPSTGGVKRTSPPRDQILLTGQNRSARPLRKCIPFAHRRFGPSESRPSFPSQQNAHFDSTGELRQAQHHLG